MKSARASNLTPERPEQPQKLPSLRGPRPNRVLKEAVEVAMRLFKEALTAYAIEKETRMRSTDDLNGEDKACRFAEQWAAEHYEDLKNAILGLLPWTGKM